VQPTSAEPAEELAEVVALAGRVRERLGRVDVLVNNAGISLLVPAEDTTPAQWRRVLEVNLTGPFLLCQAFGRMMLRIGGGSIVSVASIAGLQGVADRAAYNASKHGLVGLTRTLAAEWGGRGVRVNAVCPGWVKTEMDDADQAAGGYSDADIVGQVPMGRFAAPTTSPRRWRSWPTRRAAASSTRSPCRSTVAGRRTPAGSRCGCASANPPLGRGRAEVPVMASP
jgi:NAD(P)-dependent dehydrogenase (short-subunit alcohol dehydrogenase family)